MAACFGTIKNNKRSQMGIRLVVSDVDGTLVTKAKVVTPAALDAIRRVRERGIKFTIISSRPPQGMKVVGDVIGLTDPVPAFNGGLVTATDLKTPLREKSIDPGVARRLIDALLASGVDIWAYTDTAWFLRDANGPHAEHEAHAVKYEPTVVKDFSAIPFGRIAKVVGVSDDYEGLAAVEKKIQGEFHGEVSASRSQKYYLDITHPDANKGEGVLLLSDLLQIPTAEIATIGDMANDVYMFKKSGLSIAMGNATPEVQSAAMHVTASNEENGFAKAMEKFILSPQ